MSRSLFSTAQKYALLTIVLWSAAYVFTRIAVRHFSPAALSLLRCLTASIVLLPLLFSRPGPWPGGARRRLLVFFLPGMLGFAAYLPLFNTGLETLSSTASCVIISLVPILTALGALCIFRERLPWAAWSGILLSFSGVLIMLLWNGLPALNRGALWTLAAALLLAGYNLCQRWLARSWTSLQITIGSFLAATVLLLPVAPQATRQLMAAPPPQLLAVAILGVLSSALAYLAWTKALSIASSVSEVSNFMFLTPFLSFLLAWLLLSEFPGPETFAGGAIILLGLFCFNAGMRNHLPAKGFKKKPFRR